MLPSVVNPTGPSGVVPAGVGRLLCEPAPTPLLSFPSARACVPEFTQAAPYAWGCAPVASSQPLAVITGGRGCPAAPNDVVSSKVATTVAAYPSVHEGAKVSQVCIGQPTVPDRWSIPPRPVEPRWSNLVQKLARFCGLSGKALEAMLAVDRGLFVPGAEAYLDRPLPIGHGATISAPHIHAEALKRLGERLQPGSSCLDVGCGSGYIAAVMSRLVGPSGSVTAIDYLQPLVDLSRANISKYDPSLLGDGGCVRLVVGDGWKGCAENAPFDAIHVGADASSMPQALVDQLKPGGRMIIPVNNAYLQVDKALSGNVTIQTLMDVRFVPLVKVNR